MMRDYLSPVVVRVGQTIGTPPPLADSKWQVEYDRNLFELVYPRESALATPGPSGWVWKAIGTGQAQITLTQVVDRSSGAGAPNVARFSFQVEIRPRQACNGES